jgi:hypothetical protein
MRHARMAGLGLLGALLLIEIGAGSALAKDPYTVNTWGQYKYCDYENYPGGELTDCFAGITNGGGKGGFFEYGKVHVKLNQSIYLHGSFKGAGPEIEVEPAVHGGETLEAPPLKVRGGITLFSKALQEQEEWPAALSESWKAAKKAKEKDVYVKIEMAGNECYEVPGCLDTENILFEEGVAFRLPLKVKVTGPWLETLGGGPCYIGSDEHPIHINLTTEGAGAAGELSFSEEFTQINLAQSKLVDLGWKIEPESGPKGCGGAYESYIDAALENLLEMSGYVGAGRSGIVVLQGNLHDAAISVVQEEGEASGEIP